MLKKSYTEERSENDESAENEEAEEIHHTKASVFRLALLGIIVITPALTPGMAMSYSAIAVRQLDLNLSQTSWFTSIMSLATPFGNLFTMFLLDRSGRRISIIWSVIPSIIGWFLLSLRHTSITILFTGRLLTGFALGASSLPSTIYLAECITVNNLNLRGSLSTWTTLALSLGVLLCYGLAVLIPFTEVAFIGCILSVLSLILILVYIPESPIWLYRRGRIGDALIAQSRLGIAQPILRTKPTRKISVSTYIVETEFSLRSFIDFGKKINRKEVYKPLILTISFLFFLQFSGIYCLTGYMVDIIEVKSVKSNPYILAVISGAMQCIGVIATSFIIPYSGVKKISLFSTAGVAIGMLLLGTTTLYGNGSPIGHIIDWIHVVSVWLTIFAASFGFISVPFSILGEMFPMGAKSYASLSLIASSTFNFISLKLHPILFAHYGPVIYYVYAASAFGGTFFVALFLPETVGKTLDEIKNRFRYSSDLMNADA